MAKIDIERKPNRGWLPLLIVLAVVGLAAIGVYLYLERQGGIRPADEVPAPGALPQDTLGVPPRDTLGVLPPSSLQLPDASGELTLVTFAEPRVA